MRKRPVLEGTLSDGGCEKCVVDAKILRSVKTSTEWGAHRGKPRCYAKNLIQVVYREG